MNEIDEMCAEVFLKEQGRLFDEPVAETVDEAMEFLRIALRRFLIPRRSLETSGEKRE